MNNQRIIKQLQNLAETLEKNKKAFIICVHINDKIGFQAANDESFIVEGKEYGSSLLRMLAAFVVNSSQANNISVDEMMKRLQAGIDEILEVE